MPLTVHGAPSRGMGFDFFSKFLHVHTLEHPFAILIQFTHMVFEGVFVRFPKLRVAYLEAGCGWLPYMMDRMDEEMEKPYRVQAPLLKQKPSELIRNGQIWATCEVEEKALPHVLKQFNSKCLMWPSDYPHERLPDMFHHDLPEFFGRTDISDETRKAILHDNPVNFYRIKV
jgi:predicted TIM-barrel fold metal-dependent hydrolase